MDGNCCPAVFPTRAIVRGDATVRVISAASILAKTTRDAYMVELHLLRPEYGFHQHKGYGTPEHLEALHRWRVDIPPTQLRSGAAVMEQIPLFEEKRWELQDCCTCWERWSG